MNYTDKYLDKQDEQAQIFIACTKSVKYNGATLLTRSPEGTARYFSTAIDAAKYFDVTEEVIIAAVDKWPPHVSRNIRDHLFLPLKPNKDGSPYIPDLPAYRGY